MYVYITSPADILSVYTEIKKLPTAGDIIYLDVDIYKGFHEVIDIDYDGEDSAPALQVRFIGGS